MAMQEELNLFQINDFWNLVPKPLQKNIIRTKWTFINKFNEQIKMVTNKAKLIAQGYTQQKGIDFSKTFVLVVRLEVIRLLISYVINHDIISYQVDIKIALLNGVIEIEEIT